MPNFAYDSYTVNSSHDQLDWHLHFVRETTRIDVIHEDRGFTTITLNPITNPNPID